MKILVLLMLSVFVSSPLFGLAEGDRIRATLKDGQKIGTVSSLYDKSLLLDVGKENLLAVPFNEVSLLEKSLGVSRKSSTWGKKAFYGGTVLGAGFGSFLVNMCILEPCPEPSLSEQIGVPIVTGLMVGGVSWLVGKGIGYGVSVEHWEKIPLPLSYFMYPVIEVSSITKSPYLMFRSRIQF